MVAEIKAEIKAEITKQPMGKNVRPPECGEDLPSREVVVVHVLGAWCAIYPSAYPKQIYPSSYVQISLLTNMTTNTTVLFIPGFCQ
jgi:hypothetical protein